MKIKALFSAVVFALLPTLGLACEAAHERQAMSCVDGHVWDDAQDACVPITTG